LESKKENVVVQTPVVKIDNIINDFNPDLIISDKDFKNINIMSEQQIQTFFESKKGFLADYKVENKLVSYWFYKHCSDNGLNPQVLITNAQKESGLITMKNIPKNKRRIDWAFGVGCYDGKNAYDDPKWFGFNKQIEGSVLVNIRRYKKALNKKYPIDYITLAPESIKLNIKNAATQSLYDYCPYVGKEDLFIPKKDKKIKYEAPFGNYLFYRIFYKWFL
jgi:hypothetical protein